MWQAAVLSFLRCYPFHGHRHTSIILCLRSTGPGFEVLCSSNSCSRFLIPTSETLPVGHKKITEPINAVRRFADALRRPSTGSRAHCPCGCPIRVPCSFFLFPLLLVVPTCETGAGDSVVACPCKEAFARVSWLPSFGYFLWAPFLWPHQIDCCQMFSSLRIKHTVLHIGQVQWSRAMGNQSRTLIQEDTYEVRL